MTLQFTLLLVSTLGVSSLAEFSSQVANITSFRLRNTSTVIGVLKSSPEVDKAKAVVQFIAQVSQNLNSYETSGGELLSELSKLASLAPQFAVLGSVMSLISVFVPSQSEEDLILKDLEQIKSKMDTMQAEIANWFDVVLKAIDQEECYDKYFSYDLNLRDGYDKYMAFIMDRSELNKNDFLDSCGDNACDKAAEALLHSLSGDSSFLGCDLMDIIEKGSMANQFFEGSPKYFQSNAGALVVKVMQGIQVVSAYKSLRDNSTEWGAKVSSAYQDNLKKMSNRFSDLLKSMYDDSHAQSNIGTSTDAWVSTKAVKLSNEDCSKSLLGVLQDNYPQYNFGVFVSKKLAGGDQHCNVAPNPFYHLNWGPDRDFTILWIPKVGISPVSFLTNPWFKARYPLGQPLCPGFPLCPGPDEICDEFAHWGYMDEIRKHVPLQTWTWSKWGSDYYATWNIPKEYIFYTNDQSYGHEFGLIYTNDSSVKMAVPSVSAAKSVSFNRSSMLPVILV